jgi:hypothetical protein
MKKLYTLLAAFIITLSVSAQAPDKMSYQAVVRDASQALVASQSVGMQLSILQGSINGTAVYVETQAPTTNINGLVTLEIGGGTAVSGDFSTIDWANGPYFIKTETDPTGGANYTISGTSELMSVPYALHANTANSVSNDQVDDADADPTNEIQTLSLLGTDLTISGGNTLDLSPISSVDNDWTISGNDMFSVPSGNVGIGTATPAHKLTVYGTGTILKVNGDGTGSAEMSIFSNNTAQRPGITLGRVSNETTWGIASANGIYDIIATTGDAVFGAYGSNKDLIFGNGTGGDFRFSNGSSEIVTISSSGNVGIGTSAPTALLSVNGTANKTGGGSWAVFSDARLKQNVNAYTDGLSTLMQIQTKTFQYNGLAGIKDTEKEYVGIIAQDMQKIAPYMVREVEYNDEESGENDTYLEFDPSSLDFMIVNAIQELKAEMDELKKENAAMKALLLEK